MMKRRSFVQAALRIIAVPFGAMAQVGLPLNSCPPQDITKRLQEAAANGSKVFLGPGTYHITAMIPAAKPGFAIIGTGASPAILKFQNGASFW